ncbi:hypothetical protein [Pseudorhodobacter sp.]|uniref:hypothetical protein n=1 Tax=Pseudorhodobacter sp. TaxID=1934400 RepID=UPI002649679C|nr:hypothetical protein [Pseudorhodobacter sp.]MDN5789001.1 hypothetical protein [Pseudorhodobacter sp.]
MINKRPADQEKANLSAGHVFDRVGAAGHVGSFTGGKVPYQGTYSQPSYQLSKTEMIGPFYW